MGLLDRLKGKEKSKRAVLIGLDGTPCTLVRQLVQDGTMPNMAKLCASGSLLQMDTSIPDISSVAWTSFMTGANPGRHGIYGFMDLQPNSYKIYFPSSRHIKSQTLWAVAGQAAKRAIVINVPSTYPAQPLNGILVAGFVAVDINKATFPASLVPKLQAMDYRIDVDARKVQQSHDALMEDVLTTLDRRVKLLLDLYDNEAWDLFVGVVTETDRLQHFFMDAFAEPGHKYHSAFREFYGRIDSFIGQIGERVRDEAVLIMSDHGFTPIKQQVYLNRWLVDHGYLKLKENPRSIEDIADGSAAFAMDPGRVYVNVKGKYPGGTIAPEEASRVASELKQGLAEISDGGQPIVRRVYDRDELFSGPQLGLAPDLCVQTVYGYDLKGAVNKTQLMDREIFTGMHTQDDSTLFINSPASALRSDKPHITDVAPTLLDALGISVPPTMDGHSMFLR